MKEQTHVHYDEEGDLLELRIGKPTESYMKDLGNDIFERIEEKTGKSKGFTILNFKKRSKQFKSLDLDIPLNLEIIS